MGYSGAGDREVSPSVAVEDAHEASESSVGAISKVEVKASEVGDPFGHTSAEVGPIIAVHDHREASTGDELLLEYGEALVVRLATTVGGLRSCALGVSWRNGSPR